MTTAWQFIRIGLFIADLILFGVAAEAATWGPQVVVRTTAEGQFPAQYSACPQGQCYPYQQPKYCPPGGCPQQFNFGVQPPRFQFQRTGQGTGGVIGRRGDTLFVLTNAHVATSRTQVFLGEWVAAEIRCRDADADLALLSAALPRGEDIAISPVSDIAPQLPIAAKRHTFRIEGRWEGFTDSVVLAACRTDERGQKQCLRNRWFVASADGTSGQSGSPITVDGKLVAVLSEVLDNPNASGLHTGPAIAINYQVVMRFLDDCDDWQRGKKTPDAPPPQPPVTPTSPVDPDRIERIEGLLLQQGKAIELLLDREPQAGLPGERGPVGPQGPQGPPGEDADTQALASVRSELERLQARVSALESETYRVIVHKPDGQYDSETYRVGDDVHLRLFQRQER